jgi:hypothetical protein
MQVLFRCDALLLLEFHLTFSEDCAQATLLYWYIAEYLAYSNLLMMVSFEIALAF